MSRSMSLTKPRDTRPNLEHQCESLAITNRTAEQATRPPTRRRMCGVCVTSVPASVRCACLGVGCLSASRVCPALGVCSLSCFLGYLPVRCQATQVCSTMFTLGYSCCCACGARAVCSCAFGCSPRFLSTLTTDTAGQHGRHRHPDTHTPIHPCTHTPRRHPETHTNTDTHTHTPTDPHTNIHSHMHHSFFLKKMCLLFLFFFAWPICQKFEKFEKFEK